MDDEAKLLLFCHDLIERMKKDWCALPFMGSQPDTDAAMDDVRRFAIRRISAAEKGKDR